MKLSKQKLKRIIKEELAKVLGEQEHPSMAGSEAGSAEPAPEPRRDARLDACIQKRCSRYRDAEAFKEEQEKLAEKKEEWGDRWYSNKCGNPASYKQEKLCDGISKQFKWNEEQLSALGQRQKTHQTLRGQCIQKCEARMAQRQQQRAAQKKAEYDSQAAIGRSVGRSLGGLVGDIFGGGLPEFEVALVEF